MFVLRVIVNLFISIEKLITGSKALLWINVSKPHHVPFYSFVCEHKHTLRSWKCVVEISSFILLDENKSCVSNESHIATTPPPVLRSPPHVLSDKPNYVFWQQYTHVKLVHISCFSHILECPIKLTSIVFTNPLPSNDSNVISVTPTLAELVYMGMLFIAKWHTHINLPRWKCSYQRPTAASASVVVWPSASVMVMGLLHEIF